MAEINKEKQSAMPQKLLQELFDYDSVTGDLVNKVYRSSSALVGKPAVGVGKRGYVRICINGYTYQAHRLIWTYIHGDYPSGEQPFIDHINGIPFDNRIENLRVSSGGENQRNLKKDTRNTSGVTGIKRVGQWNGSRTKRNYYWVANWNDENGKQQTKSFPISRYGEHRAKWLAVDYRAEQIRLLGVNHSIIYSTRHGT